MWELWGCSTGMGQRCCHDMPNPPAPPPPHHHQNLCLAAAQTELALLTCCSNPVICLLLLALLVLQGGHGTGHRALYRVCGCAGSHADGVGGPRSHGGQGCGPAAATHMGTGGLVNVTSWRTSGQANKLQRAGWPSAVGGGGEGAC